MINYLYVDWREDRQIKNDNNGIWLSSLIMKKYRVVEFEGGGYGIQVKSTWYRAWKTLHFHTTFMNGALMQIAEERKTEENRLTEEKALKVKRVCVYD